MSDRKPPVDQPDSFTKPTANRGGTGIGGGLVGLAIGGLLGRRVGGVSGALVGAVAGALVGKGTAQRVNRTVEAVVDSAKNVTDGVNHSVKNVGDALKDTVEEVKPSVVGVVDAVKNIIDDVKPSVVATAQNVNHNVKDIGDAINDTVNVVKPVVNDIVDAVKNIAVDATAAEAIKDTVEAVKPSFVATPTIQQNAQAFEDTVKEINSDKPQPTKLSEKPTSKPPQHKSIPQHLSTSSQEHSNSNNIPQPLPIVKPLPELDLKQIESKKISEKTETAQKLNQQIPQLPTAKAPILAGIIIGFATITWIGLTGALSPQEVQLATNLPKLKLSLNSLPKITVEGWIFIGELNKASASKSGIKSLTKASQSTSSSIVPSVDSIVTVTAKKGVTLRKNPPQKPNFNYQEKKALATLKAGEKLKIIKVKSLTTNTSKPVTKVWVAVSRCGKACN